MRQRSQQVLAALLVTVSLCPIMQSLAATTLLDEIIVTARRTPERLGEVPLTINAFGDDAINASGIESLQTLIERVPGLYFESTWGGLFSAPSLRGQQIAPVGDLRVGVFVDGVYQANPIAVDVNTLDIERIEVVRGPQNTLFGHSTFAGAIHYVSRTPSESFQSGATVEFGSGDYRAINANVSGPLLDGSLLARLAMGAERFNGTKKNSTPAGGTLGGRNRTSAALTLATPLDSKLQAALKLRFSQSGYDQPAASALDYNDYNCGAVEPASAAWSYYCGAAPIRKVFDISPGVPDSAIDVVQATFDFSLPAFGGLFESQTSHYHASTDSFRDFDVSSAGQVFGVCTTGINCIGPIGIPRSVNRLTTANEVSRDELAIREWNQDVRWRSSGGRPTQWTVGAAAWSTHEVDAARLGVARGDLAANEQYSAFVPTDPFSVGPLSLTNFALVADPNREQITRGRDAVDRQTVAVYATVDHALSARIRARAEIRATRERRDFDNQLANFAPGFGRTIKAADFGDITPRFSIHYANAESWSGYVSAAKGSQSGGVNPVPGLLPDEQGFDPEYNWTYELHGRYQNTTRGIDMQSTLYYIDWRDAQMLGFPDTPGITNLITRNTKGVTTRGVEFSARARVLPPLQVELDFSYTDPEFRAGSDDPGSRRFCGISASSGASSFCNIGPSREGSVTALVPYIDGNLPARTPQRMWHAAIQYEFQPQRDSYQFKLRIDANGQDDVFDRAIDGAYFGSRRLLNARLSYDFGKWSVMLWGRNLNNAQYIRALASRGQIYFPTTPRPLDMIYADGRRVGLSFTYAQD
jgi:iron complex outermembrane receptor protein